ncbi:MAG TPA: sigma factor [Vicinamibacterales bacterium]|jgi:DNA-directed RNA polymerase specialized sigma24 family protein|nr:sigma factor [Vicinamibacterales bacterium]
MHRVALTLVRSSAVADEVAQEARRGALRSLDRFEGSPRQQRPYAPEP